MVVVDVDDVISHHLTVVVFFFVFLVFLGEGVFLNLGEGDATTLGRRRLEWVTTTATSSSPPAPPAAVAVAAAALPQASSSDDDFAPPMRRRTGVEEVLPPMGGGWTRLAKNVVSRQPESLCWVTA